MAGFSGKNLESSRPARLANALLHAFRRNLESELAELFGCGDSQRQIAPLMTAGQRGIDDNGLSHNFQKKTAARFRACSGVVLGGSHRGHVPHGAHRAGVARDDPVGPRVVGLGMLWPDEHTSARAPAAWRPPDG